MRIGAAFRQIAAMLKYPVFLAFLFGCFQSLALEVHFLRHGETAWNRAKVLQGSIPYTELTARGVRMAEETARGMAAAGIRYDKIYVSHLRRAYRTAEIVAKAQGMKPVVDTRLREMGMGKYEGMRYVKGEYPDENLRNFFEGTGPYVPTGVGAETMDDVAVRLKAFLDEVVRPLEGKADKVLCVAHSFVLKTLVREFAGDGASEAAKNPIQRNCCVHVLECKNGRFSVKETGRIYYDAKDFEVQPEPIMVAHRGAGDRYPHLPESSAAAYSNAVDTVCDVVKLDLQCTKDGIAVMHHDPTLKRIMGWDASITNLTYAEIYEKARYLGPKNKPTQYRIVRLDEALEITRAIPQFWVDFKYFSPRFAENALQAFRDARIDFGRIMIATYSHDALAYFQKNHPSIRRISHVTWQYRPEMKAFRGSMRTGKMPTHEKVMECMLGHIKKYGLYGVNIPHSLTTAYDVKMLHDNGVKWVSLYFVQKTERALEVRPWGADAFVTDFVGKARKAYEGGKSDGSVSKDCGESDIAWQVRFDDGRVVVSSNRVYSSNELDVRIDRACTGKRTDLRGTLSVKGTNAVVSFAFPYRLEFAPECVSRVVMPMRGREGPGIALQRRWFIPDEMDMPDSEKVEFGPKGWKSMGLPPVGKRNGPRSLERVELPDAKGQLWIVRGNDKNTNGKACREIYSCIRNSKGRGKRVAVVAGTGNNAPLFAPSVAVRQIRAAVPEASVCVLESPAAISKALADDSCGVIVNPFLEALPAKSTVDFMPMLQRIRKWIERGGIWIEAGGGYPFYRAMVPKASREWRVPYPTANADFMRLERTDGTSLSVYGVQPRPDHEPWKPAARFVPCELAVGVEGTRAWFEHSFSVYVRPGENRTTPVLRMVSDGAFESDLADYSVLNGFNGRLDRKASTELLSIMKNAPLVAVSGKYENMRAAIEMLPVPVVVRLYSYLRGGFDRQYPDHLPPNGKNFGTAAQFRELIDFIRSKGHLSSPYTNPTFWCEEPRGPSFAAAGDAALAARKDGTHYMERYGKPWGWSVSPWHSAAREANARTRAAFKKDYPVDILFEDQSGARASKLDFNPASPAPDAYIEGLLSSSEEGARVFPLGTEDGWDRMIDIHFMDEGMSWLLMQNDSLNRPLLKDRLCGRQWLLEPLMQRLFHDRTVMKHHDNKQFVTDSKSLAWTLALGYHLNARTIRGNDLVGIKQRPEVLANVRIVAKLQREVASAYFGKRLVSFKHSRHPSADADDEGMIEAEYDGGIRIKVNLSSVPRDGLAAWGWVLVDGKTIRRSEEYGFEKEFQERN